jgi:endonuclease/exonuclease/phosphatase family metal-dependent hydrolase
MTRRSLFLAAAIALAACGANEAPETAATDTPARVTVMAFNVQNLFDTIDDPGKDDKAYLPIEAKQDEAHIAECNEIEVESWRDECLTLDWDDEALGHKLGVVADTILQVNDGRGPDIVALQEVENLAVLERLRNEYLQPGEYHPAVLIEGADTRGIDVAFLTRLPLAGDPVLHPLNLPADYVAREGDTRGLIEATFELPDGALLTGYSVHFPAPFHPTEMRVRAYEHLQQVSAAIPATHNVFAAGDFNTTSTEDASERLLDAFLRPDWVVSNDLCDNCPGTHYYARDDRWSFLDMVIFMPAEDPATAWSVVSIDIPTAVPAQVTADGTPNRYRSAERTGVSDHWPVVMTLEAQ